ncbi:MAG: ribonuclease P protein component [Bryobacteraceae bacterium]
MRSKDFRRVYDNGVKFSGPLFAAFCLQSSGNSCARIGLTVPRALGGAVVRNCIKRRIREAIRDRLRLAAPGWDIVINPRKRSLTAPFPDLVKELERLLARCGS